VAQESRRGGLTAMSVQSPVAVHAGPDAAARRRSSLSLYLSLALLIVVILLLISGFLVRLDNDHNRHAVLPGAVPVGGSASGELTLTNAGWLPIDVTLQPKLPDGSAPASLPANLKVIIQRVGDGRTLYSGPLQQSMGPLLVLQPGEAAKLHLDVRYVGPTPACPDASCAAGGVPLNYTYYWNSRPAISWWWWIPLILLVAVIAAGGYWRPGRRRGDG
jgi:hypothetical protein